MREWMDCYAVLQVHLLAEPRIIKAAYRSLCQSSHPDNKGDSEKMHRLNYAYEILSDQIKRAAYDKKWIERFNNQELLMNDKMKRSMFDFSVQPLRLIVNEYMFHLQHGRFEQAYHLLSRYNRKRIFKKDYIKWQTLVAKVHRLISFDCTLTGVNDSPLGELPYLDKHSYMIFRVKVTERNLLLGRVEEDYFNRVLVNEDGEWAIFLINSNIRKIIKKYQKIVESHSSGQRFVSVRRKRVENLYRTGWVSKVSFLNNCEHEQLRHDRYDAAYSIICIRLSAEYAENMEENEPRLFVLLEENTRILDSLCHLRKNMILLLLPENQLKQAQLALDKLLNLILDELGTDVVDRAFCVEQTKHTVKELLSEVVDR